MATKYYQAENVGRAIAGINFSAYDIVAGCRMGVHATDNEAEQAALDKLVAEKRIWEIDQNTFDLCLKKKQRFSPELKSLNVPSESLNPTDAVLKKAPAAVAVESGPVVDVQAAAVVEDAKESVDVRPLPDPSAPIGNESATEPIGSEAEPPKAKGKKK